MAAGSLCWQWGTGSLSQRQRADADLPELAKSVTPMLSAPLRLCPAHAAGHPLGTITKLTSRWGATKRQYILGLTKSPLGLQAYQQPISGTQLKTPILRNPWTATGADNGTNARAPSLQQAI